MYIQRILTDTLRFWTHPRSEAHAVLQLLVVVAAGVICAVAVWGIGVVINDLGSLLGSVWQDEDDPHP